MKIDDNIKSTRSTSISLEWDELAGLRYDLAGADDYHRRYVMLLKEDGSTAPINSDIVGVMVRWEIDELSQGLKDEANLSASQRSNPQ